jgi:hypothetical protein
MSGTITSLPPLVQQPPGGSSSNPAGLPGVTYTAAIPNLPQTWSALQTFLPGTVKFAGSTSGGTFLNASAIASGTVNLPAVSGVDTLLANNNTAVVTNKSIDGLTNTLTNIPAASFGSVTGTGAVVLNNGPSISGATITTSTYNGNSWTAGTGTLTLGAGKTATISNTLTFTGTDGSSAAFGAGGIVAYKGTDLSQFAATTSAQLAGVISDETGTGALVFANGPTLIAPALGTPASGVATNLTGTAAGLTAGNVTTNANLTGPVTSVGNATSIGANQVTRAMEAQGIARSVIGVTGNATANVADIQGTASQFLGVNSAGTALAFQTMSGDVILSGPAATIAANAVTNAKMATMGAWTFKANNTSSAATPTDITIDGLTLKASPAAGDEVIIWDVAGAALKKATVSGVGSSAGVSSIAGNTGAFTVSNGIKNVTNDIQLSLTNATLTATPANPTGTTSGSPLMMGLGSTCKITPVYSGRVRVQFTGLYINSTAGNATGIRAQFGTGAAPANAAALTGTQFSATIAPTTANAGAGLPFTMSAIITGLSVGTQVWFDLAINAGGATSSLASITCEAMEF